MKTFAYERPRSIEEAVKALQNEGGKISAGGTDLLGTMKDKIHAEYVSSVVSLKGIEGLSYIKEEDGVLKIGAMTKLADIQRDELVAGKYPLLAEAAQSVASPQLRNMATIGGNICQEPRCWYYRYPDNKFDCMRKGGALCNAMTGNSKYHSIFGSADVCPSPCETECPNGNPIPEYFEMVRNGDIAGAARVLLEANPLAAVTGRVCPHSCESGCNRAEYDDSLSIREIERFIGDYALERHEEILGASEARTGRKAAIVGAGPAGLTAAFRLVRAGYEVTIYDACKEPGGMLYYGIPEYRLPKSVVAGIAGMLASLGVEFKLGVKLGREISIESLENEFDAVLLATGAWADMRLGCPGEDSKGVLSGIDFLYKVAEGADLDLGETVAVVGGGNTAMDACRTAKRLGVKNVFVLYRRTREEMPADEEEITAAIEEGVEFMFLVAPVGIAADAEGRAGLVRLQKMELGQPDASGRRRPVPIEGAIDELGIDLLINAVGQRVDMDIESYKAREKIFAAGDANIGPATVVEAMADAGKTADEMICFLGGSPGKKPVPRDEMLSFDPDCLELSEHLLQDIKPASDRTLNTEDARTAVQADIAKEASRCLNCGCVAISPSDIAPSLIALGGAIITTKRKIPASEFFKAGVCSSTILDTDEIVTEIQAPAPAAGSVGFYNKFRYRKSIDFPVVGVAACFTMKDGVFTGAKIVLGAVSPSPMELKDVGNFLIGKKPSDELACQAADLAMNGTLPLLENYYKIKITRALVRRAIASQK